MFVLQQSRIKKKKKKSFEIFFVGQACLHHIPGTSEQVNAVKKKKEASFSEVEIYKDAKATYEEIKEKRKILASP